MEEPSVSTRRRRPPASRIQLAPSLVVLFLTALILPNTCHSEECGNCFGAGDPGQCCNSCDDIIRAYKKKKWGYKESDFGPCRDRDAKVAKEHKKVLESEKHTNQKVAGNANNNNQKKAANNNKPKVDDDAKKREAEIEAKLKPGLEAKTKREEAEATQKKKDAEAARQKEIADRVKKSAEQAAAAKKKREEEALAKKKADGQTRQREEERKRQEEQKDAAAKAAAERRAQLQEKQHQQANERMAKKNKGADNESLDEKQDGASKPMSEVDRVKSKIYDKIQDVREHHPLVDKTASVLAKTAHAIDEVSHKAMESEAGQATLHKAKDLYAKASEGAGTAAHKLVDRVAPSASAKYVSERSHSLIGGFIMIVLGGIAALLACTRYLNRSKKRRPFPGIRKEKADLDYNGDDIEGGAVLRDGNGDKGQPFQLYHEFEYKMRRRYQGTSYSYASADSPPQATRTPPQSMQSNTYTYRQQSVGKNGEPILVTYSEEYKDKPIMKQVKTGGMVGKSSQRRLLATAIGLASVGYVGVAYFMPADMSFSELWLMTAEFVDAKLGHHGMVL